MDTDAVLYGRWKATRDAEAFAQLVARHSGMVYGVCCRVLRNPADAEDVAQQCFTELARARATVHQSLAGWLHTLAVHRSLDHRRSEMRRRRRETHFQQETPASVEPEWDETMLLVDEAIAGLSSDVREAIVHRFLEGRTQQETAEALGVPRSTVQYRLDRGVADIRRFLEKKGVSAGSGMALLGPHLLYSAPPTLTAALGKIAVAGGSAAAAGASAGGLLVGGLVVSAKHVAIGVAAVAIAATAYLALSISTTPGSPQEPAVTATESPADAPPASSTPAATPIATEAPPEAPVAQQAPPAPEEASLSISGRVVDARGMAGAGVSVSTRSEIRLKGGTNARATSAADGGFALDGLTESQYDLIAYKQGMGYAFARHVKAPADGVTLTLTPVGQVSGRVYDMETNEGIPNASLFVIPKRQSDLMPAVVGLLIQQVYRTREDGAFRLELPAPAEYVFVVKDTPGYQDYDDITTPSFSLKPAEELAGQDIALQPAAALAGTVYSPDGKPVPGATVALLDLTRGSNVASATTETDPNGLYRFDSIPPGRACTVRAAHPDYGSVDSPSVTLAMRNERDGFDLWFAEGHTLSGRVITSDGKGVPGLRVSLNVADIGSAADLPFMEATTGGNGEFSIGRVAGGEYVAVVALWKGPKTNAFTNYRSPAFSMPDERDLRDLVLDVGPAVEGSIAGRITNEEGEPLSGVPVAAHASRTAHSFTVTNPDGKYELHALGGSDTWGIEVFESPPYLHNMRDGVAVGSRDVDFTLERSGLISGTVSDSATGRPVSVFEVREREWQWTPVASENGEFTLSGIRATVPVLEVRAEGYSIQRTEPITLDSHRTATGIAIALTPDEGVTGVVVDAATGDPVEGARVRILDDPSRVAWYTQGQGWSAHDPITDAQGRFTLYGLTPGEPADLMAWKEGYTAAIALGTTEGELVLAISPGGSLHGTLTQNGAPLVNTHIDFRPQGAEDSPGYGLHAVSNPSGEFVVRHIPAGTYDGAVFTKVTREQGKPWFFSFVIEEGKTTEVALNVPSQ